MLRLLIIALVVVAAAARADDLPRKTVDVNEAQMQAARQKADAALQDTDRLMGDVEFRRKITRDQQRVQEQGLTDTHSLVTIPDSTFQNAPTINLQQQDAEAQVKDRMAPLVLVSLSMPADALKNLSKEAERLDTGIFFRGLKGNSFVQMRQAMHDAGSLSAQIDPTYFMRYGVSEVPAFILPLEPVPLCTDDNCPVGRYVKVAGSMSLESALEFISRNSAEPDAKPLAEKWLQQLRGTP